MTGIVHLNDAIGCQPKSILLPLNQRSLVHSPNSERGDLQKNRGANATRIPKEPIVFDTGKRMPSEGG